MGQIGSSMLLRRLSSSVFACCKRLERWGDAFIGYTGPVFVGLACLLLAVCVFTYFDVVFRDVFCSSSSFMFLFGLSLSTYLVYSFFFLYYMSCTVSAGSPRDTSKQDKPTLARFFHVKRSARLNAIKALQQPKSPSMPVHDSSPEHQQRMERSQARTCRKCPSVQGREPAKPERAHHCRICGTCL